MLAELARPGPPGPLYSADVSGIDSGGAIKIYQFFEGENMSMQNEIEMIKDQYNRGELTTDEANVKMVLTKRVLIVTKLPAGIRKALNEAVRRGELIHMKKDKLLPEAYCHPQFEYLAKARRAEIVNIKIGAIKSVCI